MTRRLSFHVVLGIVATILSAIGTGFALLGTATWSVPAGVLIHVIGAALSVKSARLRREGELTEVEADTVVCMAVFTPIVGPALAWRLPRRDAAKTMENAHEVIERYLGHVKPPASDHERTLFTGDHDADLARELDTESYLEVIRHGDTDQKRSALFRLAELGEPRHLALIRNCLTDEDQEVRLYAHGELDRLTRVHETAITEARMAESKDPHAFETKLALGVSHYDLAVSGVLDAATAKFYFRAAANYAAEARKKKRDSVEAILLESRSHARMGAFETALETLDELPSELRETPEVSIAEAEIAFRTRNFDVAREIAGRLLFEEVSLPGWLNALVSAGTPVFEEPEDDEEDAGDEPDMKACEILLESEGRTAEEPEDTDGSEEEAEPVAAVEDEEAKA